MPPVTPQAQLLSQAEARALAQQEGWREKVLAYITRRPDELLVFEHTAEYPEAGIQVPAGGVDAAETPEQAVLREVYEETGLRLSHALDLGSQLWTTFAPSRIRHFYWLTAPQDTPDTWSHVVSDGQDDKGMTFLFRFAPLSDPQLIPGYGFESALPALQKLQQRGPSDTTL